MSSKWQWSTLGDLTINYDGKRKPVKESERSKGLYPYYGASGIVDYVDGYLFDGEYLLIAEDGENLRSRQTPIAFMATDKFWVNNHAHIVTGNELADTRFLMYALLHADINSFLTGAVMPKLTQGNLNKIPIHCPPIEMQRLIARQLGVFDERINLLREANTTLESIAQALFKSWFIDFDPVYAKAEGREPEGMDAETAALFPDSFEESELGVIPKGWRSSSVGESFTLIMGQSPAGSTYNDHREGLPFYQGRTDFGFRFPCQRVYCSSPVRLAQRGDILISVRAPVGDVNVALEKCCLGRGVAGIRHKENYQSFALYSIKNLHSYFELYQNEGTVFGSINKNDFQRLPITSPSIGVTKAFDKMVSILDESIRINEEKVRTLKNIRDLLLPRLISGQLQLESVNN